MEKRNDFSRDIMHFGKRPADGFDREIMSFGKRAMVSTLPFCSSIPGLFTFCKQKRLLQFDHEISPFDGRQFSDFNRDMLAFGKRDDFERSIMSFGRRRK
uniref:Uncharacterized protein n=1 Tax=Angiostrongylus cantonensis TaxID=6313 RepID=A0A0K0CZH2_ANGCA